MPSPSIIVLGASGMLGSTVLWRLRANHPGWRVEGAARAAPGTLRLDAERGRSDLQALLLTDHRFDFVINCVGVLKNAIDAARAETIERAVRVNALFPHELADVAGHAQSRVIHVSTDAVFSGAQTNAYLEHSSPDPADAYGMTKALGEGAAPHVLNVRCSLVGRDHRGRGLVDWYLAVAANRAVSGYTDYVWNPVTTVQVADLCASLVHGHFGGVRERGHVVHFAPNAALSKAEFLLCLRDVAGRGAPIEPGPSPDGPCSRVLGSACPTLPPHSHRHWPDLVAEMLAEFASRSA